jgi:ATP-dependent DNA helicase DinG
MRDAVTRALDHDGELAAQVPGFSPRTAQQSMADAVAAAMEDEATLVVEAGTGTGKTFAYLVPALLSGRKVIIATGTRTLQDQLYQRDLPMVAEALGHSGARTAVLKGRNNYLCLYRLQMAAEDGRFDSPDQSAAFERLRDWSGLTETGDLVEAPVRLNDPALFARVTSTSDNCLGQECPLYDDCFLMEARRRAQEADILVVNHHLLMADWAVRESGYGEVLPAADAYILDEAHQLPEIAAQFFGVSITARQLQELARDAAAEQRREAADAAEIPEAAGELNRVAAAFREALGASGRREPWTAVSTQDAVQQALNDLSDGLTGLRDALGGHCERGKGLEACHRRAEQLVATLDRFLAGDTSQYVQWFETYSQAFVLRLTPLDVASAFRSQLERHPASWVFTSATLTVDNRFDHFIARLGLGDPETQRLDSPFDYERNALLYLPSGLPAPNAANYLERFLDRAEAVLAASRGRAFLLFTSHRALQQAAQRLRSSLDLKLLVQGEASQQRLLDRFRASGNAVLLGTQSFWEGVDVRGEALSVVMIDKLPFTSPSDPVVQARIESLREQGGNPFMQYQVPHAVITLRQGVGRLIRDDDDRGVLVIGDNRLTTKGYGRVFLDSLPPMPVTEEIGEVRAFLASAPDADAAGDRGAPL